MSKHAPYIPGQPDMVLQSLVNGQPDFLEVTTPASTSDELEVSHGLGRKPRGVIVIRSTSAISVYDSGTEWTTGSLFVKFSVADADVTLAVF